MYFYHYRPIIYMRFKHFTKLNLIDFKMAERYMFLIAPKNRKGQIKHVAITL